MSKQKLKRLIENVNFIDKSEKSKWIDLLDSLNKEEMEKIHKYFKNNKQKELDTALAIIFKKDMEEDLHEKVNKITKMYIKKFKK